MKIPTLLGLALLITAVSLGIILYYYSQKTQAQTAPVAVPQNIQVVNIEDNNVTVVWQTATPSIGQVSYSESYSPKQLQNDNRDHGGIKEHFVHFTTLENLKPDTKYTYQIVSGPSSFPDHTLDFKTAKTLKDDPPLDNKPIRGTVLNTNLNPIDEGLVFLKIKDAQDIATFTSTAGNFIIPLNSLRNSDLSAYYKITDKIDAVLQIQKNALKSEVTLTLPLKPGTLPPFTIGQDINITELPEASNSSTPVQTTQPNNTLNEPSGPLDERSSLLDKKFDLNNDGKVNSLDLATIIDLYNRNQQDKKADFNGDGVVDKKDIDLLSASLQS